MLAKTIRQPKCRHDIEMLCVEMLRDSIFYRDLTGVDVDFRLGGDAGAWDVMQLWRGHVLELPQGRSWEAAGRERIAYLASRYALTGD